jgi:class 3 adenylate cyclase/predicted ATPase
MHGVADWLEKLGLSEYTQRFADNAIDLSVLPDLTDQDLEKIGVLLGHRRKILKAIAALNSGSAVQSDAATTKPSAAPPTPALPIDAAGATGERRYLTVMFCDLVGSTGISAQLDAEEWRDLVGAYLDAASAAVAEMGGHVAKKLGDGLMCLFGYPLAHENDAERAARAALSIQRALTELNRKNAGTAKPELVARIGLESGPAVLDASGEVYGDVANIAARVQALAEPGAVLVTARVQRQVAGLFVAEERGTHTLKGVPEPTALFRLVRASGGGRRSGQRNLTPLVGRDDEMAMLMRRWERARQGDGQLVMIVGEPGLGKSRLIEEFHGRLADTPHTWVEWSCSQLLQNTPLHPIAEWGRQRFGGADVPAERRIAELESSLAQVKLDPAENLPLLAPLLDIPLQKERAPALAAEELRRRQLAALTNWVMAGARTQPLVLALEDLHWADPTTLDVLRGIAERGALAPLYIVATTRPEFRPPWGMRSHHGTISLAPLDRGQVQEMVAELSARHALPRDVVEDVAARTGGVPLFVEEVTRLLLDLGEGGGGIQAIPPTLQQSLMARLDRLGAAREVAQIGSVIGRGFSYGLIRDVAGTEDAALQTALEKLAEADIVLVQGLPPESDYRFKHALIQDAAYENLLKSRRQVLHRRAAEVLRDRFADTASAEPEALAYHFTQAGMTDAAIEWWGKAGDQALRRSAFQEAISHLGKAIEMADKSADTTPQTTKPEVARAKLQTNFGIALLAARGDSAPETTAAFARAEELAAAVDDPMERLSANYGLWAGYLSRGEVGPLRAIAEVVLRDIEGKPPSPEAAVAHRLAGTTEWYLGNFELARAHLEQALAMFDPRRDHHLTYRFGRDTGVSAMVFMALALWPLGETDRACRIGEEMLARAVASGHMLTTVYGHFQCALLHVARRDAVTTAPLAEAVVKLAREHGMALYSAYGEFLQPWARWHLGDREGGLDAMRRAIAACHDMGNLVYMTLLETALAEAEAEAGEIEAALASIDRTVALTERTGHRWNEADTHRARGEILLKRDPANTGPAENAFLTAIAVAQQQKAKSFELRAALSLGKLYQSTGRPADAHAILALALEGFSSTPEFPEIEKAQALLEVLEQDEVVKAESARRERRVQLQLAYGAALMSARGYGAEDTVKAFDRARELSAGVGRSVDQLALLYGTWLGAVTTESFEAASKASAALLAEATQARNRGVIGVAHRAVGATLLYGGLFDEAKHQFDEATSLLASSDEPELAQRFNGGPRAAVHSLRAVAAWVTSDFDAAARYAQEAVAEAEGADDAMTKGYVYGWAVLLAAIRRDVPLTGFNSRHLLNVVAGTGLRAWAPAAEQFERWSRSMSGGGPFSASELRAARPVLKEVGHDKLVTPVIGVLAAEAEVRNGRAAEAIALLGELIAEVRANGLRWHEAELLRVSGEARLFGPSADPDRAGHDLGAAIAVAREQGARAFELRAALSLAKLHHSIRRPLKAHDVLAPALEGFSPTPEFPEIAEAQALLDTLGETDEVKTAAAARQRRLKLQTSYGQAVMWSKGYAAPETAAAFARAQELSVGTDNSAERFVAYFAKWAVGMAHAELASARETAQTFVREAEREGRGTERVVGLRILGLTSLQQGDFIEARAHLEEALRTYDPERDQEAKFRYGQDAVAGAFTYLAFTSWALGEVGATLAQTEEGLLRALGSNHPSTQANINIFTATFGIARGDFDAVRRAAQNVMKISQEHGLAHFALWGALPNAWARADRGTRTAELREALEAYTGGQHLPLYQGLLAELEAEGQGAEAAVARIDAALTLADETGEHWADAFLHRIRGEILLKRDPANTAPAEEAFLTAIAIAQRQKAKSFELRAALSLAKLYQSNNRAADGHTVLAPALEGFSPTPEFPEIEEAQELLATLAS